ncbi:hypothetical protein [Sphingomonas carotinifaciens]|uniref:hypothetical protein n=1 Tax=Sphingomonas carotinifaciens TaxID=1166323 RepID=UPI0012374AC8|nr:hypothetical protein [Sphingomonas carotinifaciens]
MKKLVAFLASSPTNDAQFVVSLNTPLTDTNGKPIENEDGDQKFEDVRYIIGRVVEYDDIGILIARSNGAGGLLEAYPWGAVRAILTTLPEGTDLTAR